MKPSKAASAGAGSSRPSLRNGPAWFARDQIFACDELDRPAEKSAAEIADAPPSRGPNACGTEVSLLRTVDGPQCGLGQSNGVPTFLGCFTENECAVAVHASEPSLSEWTLNGEQANLPHLKSTSSSSSRENECSLAVDTPPTAQIYSLEKECDKLHLHPGRLSLSDWSIHAERVNLSDLESSRKVIQVKSAKQLRDLARLAATSSVASSDGASTASEMESNNFFFVLDEDVTKETFPGLVPDLAKNRFDLELEDELQGNPQSSKGRKKARVLKVLWCRCYHICSEVLGRYVELVHDGVEDNRDCHRGIMSRHYTAALRRSENVTARKVTFKSSNLFHYPLISELGWKIHCFRMTASAEPRNRESYFDYDTWRVCNLMWRELEWLEDTEVADSAAIFIGIADQVDYSLDSSLYEFNETVDVVAETVNDEAEMSFLLSYSKKLRILSLLRKAPPLRPRQSGFDPSLYATAELMRKFVTCTEYTTAEVIVKIVTMLEAIDYRMSHIHHIPSSYRATMCLISRLKRNPDVKNAYLSALGDLARRLQNCVMLFSMET